MRKTTAEIQVMREDYQDNLDKMFSDGYVVIYTCPDAQIRMNIYNPHSSEVLYKYYDLLQTERD